jgi:hypothetical protein
MPQVSIGQAESLDELIRDLQAIYEQVQETCSILVNKAKEKADETEEEVRTSQRLLEEAEEALRSVRQELEEAERCMSDSEIQLSDAECALSVCEAGGGYDEDGNYIPPDCSLEESEVVAATTEVSVAEQALSEAREKLTLAEEKLQRMRDRLDLANETHSKAKEVQEFIIEQSRAHLQNIAGLVQTGSSRLAHAKAALDEYFASNPDAKAFYDWLHWKKESNQPITPQDIHDRFNLNSGQLKEFLQYLSYRDPAFREKIAAYRRELANAQGPAERKLVQDKIRKNFSGLLAEKIAEYALKPLGNVKIHVTKTTKDGKVTITDIVVEDLNNPVILGKGKGMSAPKGGKISVEVKSGRASYLKSQQDHMAFQSQGHEDADASFILCTRDIKDLSPEEEEMLREKMREAGSPLIGMLPRKDELDKACWDAVTGDETQPEEKPSSQTSAEKETAK